MNTDTVYGHPAAPRTIFHASGGKLHAASDLASARWTLFLTSDGRGDAVRELAPTASGVFIALCNRASADAPHFATLNGCFPADGTLGPARQDRIPASMELMPTDDDRPATSGDVVDAARASADPVATFMAVDNELQGPVNEVQDADSAVFMQKRGARRGL
jgi:hypothetical protein